ncbi:MULTISPECIES: hypothetical protein [unclassified Endozoicomonas]|uniref:hypothetical protein n=1 Tax=unclassified Endozoicomonas TaxID=2644528 RepID=UPI002147DF3E|nr:MULTISPECIES: hypothetical protein [unclassified Endozoicomonas]
MLLLLFRSVVCQAEAWTERFILEFEENEVFPDQSFSIKRGLLASPGTPSDLVNTRNYAGISSSPDDKRHKFNSYGVKTLLIESISWQWLYATHLQVYETILATKDVPLSSTPYSWLPVEVVVAIGWLLNSYWNPDSLSFKPIEQQAATTMLTLEGHSFAAITMVHGSGHNQQPFQPSEPSGQPTAGTPCHLTGSFTNPLNTDSADGNGGSQQTLHTLGLNCFIFPCHGVCSFRSSSDSREPAEWPLNSEKSMTDNYRGGNYKGRNYRYSISAGATTATDPTEPAIYDVTMHRNQPANSDDWIIIHSLLSLRRHSLPEKTGISFTPSHCQQSLRGHTGEIHSSQQQTCDVTVFEEDGQPRPCGKICKNAAALSVHKSSYHTGQKLCDATFVGEDGQPRLCGKVCKNAKGLSDHKRKAHSGQQTCNLPVVGENGQQQPCGWVCKNAKVLSDHKSRRHPSEHQICNITVAGNDGQLRPCGMVYKNVVALSDHKRKTHAGPQTCYVNVLGVDGKQRPCGAVYKNAKSLSVHKSSLHSGQKTCVMAVVGDNGQLRSCGTVCKNAQALRDHRRRDHSEQQTCDVTVTTEYGDQRSCGKVCKNAQSLASHKYICHTGQYNCEVTVAGEDGQLRPCGKVCKNKRTLWDHKRTHRKRISYPVNQDGEPSPKKVN